MPKVEHEQDIILVRNIDEPDCEEMFSDVLLVSRVIVDPDTNAKKTEWEEVLEEWAHKDFFQVKYDGTPFRIEPGKTRLLPRYVAKQFAKHLADHVLTKLGEERDVKGMVNNRVERLKVLGKIMVKVAQPFIVSGDESKGEQAAREVAELNKDSIVDKDEEKPLDLGEVPDKAVGVLEDEKVEVPDKDIAKVKDNKEEKDMKGADDKPLPPKKELMKQCKDLGIEFKVTDTKASLVAKIQKF